MTADYVLVRGGAWLGSSVYHLPDPDDPDVPKCGAPVNADKEWHRKDPDVIPHHRCCRNCEHGRPTPVGQQGTPLATKLRRADPDELGGGAD